MEQRLAQAAVCLPPNLRRRLEQLPIAYQQQCEEIRLRVCQPIQLTIQGKEKPIGERLKPEELSDIFGRATEYSIHTYADQLRQGYLTLQGGHRIGICGQTAVQGGNILSFRRISSMNIRIARQMKGAAQPELLKQLTEGGLCSALFLSPPGRGKTTLLRDIARQLSDSGIRIGLADERSELAALYCGVPQFDIGTHTDVLDGCPKAEAAMMLVKTMSPQVIVLDELTAEADLYAAEYAAHCGAAVMASAHAWNMEDFQMRPLYQKLLERKIFSKVFCIGADRRTTRMR